jgi:hypothetical protein
MGGVAVVISRMHEKNRARQMAAVASDNAGRGTEWSWMISLCRIERVAQLTAAMLLFLSAFLVLKKP